MSAKINSHSPVGAAPVAVGAPDWNKETRAALGKLIQSGAGKRLPVVFDFDNTIIRGDVGEATLAVLARSGVLTPAGLPAWLCPPIRRPGEGRREFQSCADVYECYLAMLAPTSHACADPSPYANGYAWAVKVMTGLRVADVLGATRSAFALSQPGQPGFIQVTPGRTSVAAPSFYPEMVELLAELIRHEFDVWIVSASNVWSVRWMVQHALNPLLHARKAEAGIRADHIIGISTLLADAQGALFKDSLLVKENPGYAALETDIVSELRLTSHLQFPLPAYSGKVACIYDAIGCRPYLCAGDSPNDHAMMAVSEHQLWIAPQGGASLRRISVIESDWMTQPGYAVAATAPGLQVDHITIP
jgi:hypothetical protein